MKQSTLIAQFLERDSTEIQDIDGIHGLTCSIVMRSFNAANVHLQLSQLSRYCKDCLKLHIIHGKPFPSRLLNKVEWFYLSFIGIRVVR